MRIEVLHIDACPHSAEAAVRVGMALAALGYGRPAVHLRLLESSEDATGTEFAGSPTITVDGADIFPAGTRSSELACRIYRTPGGFAGLPTVDQITEALKGRGF